MIDTGTGLVAYDLQGQSKTDRSLSALARKRVLNIPALLRLLQLPASHGVAKSDVPSTQLGSHRMTTFEEMLEGLKKSVVSIVAIPDETERLAKMDETFKQFGAHLDEVVGDVAHESFSAGVVGDFAKMDGSQGEETLAKSMSRIATMASALRGLENAVNNLPFDDREPLPPEVQEALVALLAFGANVLKIMVDIEAGAVADEMDAGEGGVEKSVSAEDLKKFEEDKAARVEETRLELQKGAERLQQIIETHGAKLAKAAEMPAEGQAPPPPEESDPIETIAKLLTAALMVVDHMMGGGEEEQAAAIGADAPPPPPPAEGQAPPAKAPDAPPPTEAKDAPPAKEGDAPPPATAAEDPEKKKENPFAKADGAGGDLQKAVTAAVEKVQTEAAAELKKRDDKLDAMTQTLATMSETLAKMGAQPAAAKGSVTAIPTKEGDDKMAKGDGKLQELSAEQMEKMDPAARALHSIKVAHQTPVAIGPLG